MGAKIFIQHDGKSRSISEWSRRLGWSYSTLRKRLAALPIEEALKSKIDVVGIRFRGENLTINQWADRLDVSSATVRARLLSMSKKEALTRRFHERDRKATNGKYLKNCNKSERRVTYKGIEHTVNEWSRIMGIKAATIHSRLYKGVSEENLFAPVVSPSERKKGLK